MLWGRGSAQLARQSSLLGASGASAVALAAPKSLSPPPPCASAVSSGFRGFRAHGLRPRQAPGLLASGHQTPQRPQAATSRRPRAACAPCRVPVAHAQGRFFARPGPPFAGA